VTEAAPEFLSRLEDLPRGSRVCLYGAGQGGAGFRALLRERRPDVAVVAFVDDFRAGEKDGVPVVTPAGLAALPGFDLVLVTSTYWRDIARGLRERGTGPFRVVDPVLYFGDHVFDDEEARELAPCLAAARALLARPEDRTLYDLVVANRRRGAGGAGSPLELFSRTVARPREYLDFIATAPIRTIVEGGVMDGKNTAEFLEFLPPDGAIWGFEPLIEVYEAGPWRAAVERHGGCRVLPLALWERRARLAFEPDPANAAGGRVVAAGERPAAPRQVEAVALDEFVAEQGVGRVDFIKLDIEGAEPEALRGARAVIARDRPQLAVCIYHRKEHLCRIPLLLAELLPDCVHRLGHYSSSFWDTVWYAIPREHYQGQPGEPRDA
jgi:FkbM family methyltransferase